MGDIKIRFAAPSDAEPLLKIYAPYVLKTAITFEYDVPTVEEFAKRIEKTLESYPYLVAERGGKICGYAYAGRYYGREAYKYSAEMSIYIDENERDSGVGGKLYKTLEFALQKMNVCNLYAAVAAAEMYDEHLTDASARFHEHMGYKKIAVFDKCGYKFGRWYSLMWLEKTINRHEGNPPPFRKAGEIREIIEEHCRKIG